MLLKLDKSVAGWRPQVDAAVQGLQHDMEELKLHVLKLEKQSEEGGNSSNTSQASRVTEEGVLCFLRPARRRCFPEQRRAISVQMAIASQIFTGGRHRG